MSDPSIGGEPSEEELRAAYEAELSRITATDMILQAAVSLLNIGARRLGSQPEQAPSGADLEQVRDAIDGASALVGILERRLTPRELGPLREALSRLQLAYAREAGETARQAPAGEQAETGPQPGSEPAPGAEEDQHRPGPAESSGRLWVPGQ